MTYCAPVLNEGHLSPVLSVSPEVSEDSGVQYEEDGPSSAQFPALYRFPTRGSRQSVTFDARPRLKDGLVVFRS